MKPAKRFVKTSSATVTDSSTALEWLAAPLSLEQLDYEAAKRAVNACRVNGQMDWRLPTKLELLSLSRPLAGLRPRLTKAGFRLWRERTWLLFWASEGERSFDSGGRRVVNALAGRLSGDFGLFETACVLAVRAGGVVPVPEPIDATKLEASVRQALDELARSVAPARDRRDLDEIWDVHVETMIEETFGSGERAFVRDLLSKRPHLRSRFETRARGRSKKRG